MKVEQTSRAKAIAKASARKKDKPAESEADGVADSVTLSADAGLLQTASASAPEQAASPERLEAIKQAIRDGRFQVNPEAIADRLIETAKELVLGRGKS